jgi:hypothetical protein
MSKLFVAQEQKELFDPLKRTMKEQRNVNWQLTNLDE